METLLQPDRLQRVLLGAWAMARSHIFVWTSLLQVGCILAALLIARLAAKPVRTWLEPHLERIAPAGPLRQLGIAAVRLPFPLLAVLLLWIADGVLINSRLPHDFLRVTTSLLNAWIIIRLSTTVVRDATLSKLIAVAAWLLAALNILNLLGPSLALLDAIALHVGAVRISVLAVFKGGIALTVLLWLANGVSRLIETRLHALPNLSPAFQVLTAKLIKISLMMMAVLVALGFVGIDLTAFAVFSGAVGVGLGFGLQKVVSNLISGVILLLDRSIKPGDVIEVGTSYGWITRMNARYVSVVTRDNTEYLIPNEDLITQRVINWSYTNNLVRLKIPVGISYDSDIRKAMALCIEAAHEVDRALDKPAPACLLRSFGDSAIELEVRFWIKDPQNGTSNVRSAILLGIWERFQTHGVKLPFPQRELHIRSVTDLPPHVSE